MTRIVDIDLTGLPRDQAVEWVRANFEAVLERELARERMLLRRRGMSEPVIEDCLAAQRAEAMAQVEADLADLAGWLKPPGQLH